MFIAAEKVAAPRALEIGLVDAVVEHPIAEAMRRIASDETPRIR
jgi:enoyl-CoA hydratase/carnithine racemase